MPEPNDHELLAEFARNESDAAFAALVARHVNLVYSAALRFTGNPHHAEEITQAVFLILARKAGSLGRGTVLSGWLYQAARLTAANFAKGEIRRQRREQEAYMQSTLNEPDAVAWEQIAPLLEEAMGRLGETDRNAVVLRFFENKSLQEVGAALGLEKRAAQKRVARGLEKLRDFFTKRGVTLPVAMIATAVTANSVQAAPVALAKTISAAAITKDAAAGGSTLALVKGALKIMAWTKMKTAAVAVAAVILAGGTTITVVQHYRTHSLMFSWTKELSDSDNARFVRLTGTTPADAAKTFFDACGREDWAEVAKFWDPRSRHPLDDSFKSYIGSVQVVSLGKPFKGRVIIFGNMEYPGVFVPYEIRFKDGTVRRLGRAPQTFGN